jgi:hypothetical protein
MNIQFHLFFIYLVALNICKFTAGTSSSGTYSLQFRSSVVQSVEYIVTVNDVMASAGIEGTNPTSSWIDFSALPGDVISVLLPYINSPYAFYYVVNNAAGGGGTDIYDSRATIFTPVNTCTESLCEYMIIGSNFGSSSGNVYVNNVLVVDNFTGAQQNFNLSAGDSIRIEFSYDAGNTEISYNFGPSDSEEATFWFYNAYGTNTLITNPVVNPNRPPFGGNYYPITSEQVSTFASTIGSGNQNSIWVPLTLPSI